MGDFHEEVCTTLEEVEAKYQEMLLKKSYYDFANIGKTLLFYMALQVIGGFVSGFVLVAMLFQNHSQPMADSSETLLLWISLLTSLLTFWYARRHLQVKAPSKTPRAAWKQTHIIRYAIVMLGLNQAGGMIVMLIDALLEFLGKAQLSSPDFSMQGDIAYDVMMIITVVIVAPLFEEYIFRGAIFRTLQRYDTRFAILVSALLFAGMHLNIVQGIPAFFMGLVAAYVAYQSNSLWPCILLHFINNALVTLLDYLPLEVVWVNILVEGFFVACMLYAFYRIWKCALPIHNELSEQPAAPQVYKRFFCCWSNVMFLFLVLLLLCLEFFV